MNLSKFKTKVKSHAIRYDGESHEIFLKDVSFSLAVQLSNQTIPVQDRFLIAIMKTWCDESGVMVFDEDTNPRYVAENFSPDFIQILGERIIASIGHQQVSEDIVKKPVR